ncbi:formate dehydrogenase major subunit [Desulfitispora alkaliphila]
MTNHWIDYKNSDAFLVIGANPAENHPLAMKWIQKAQEERGAKLIVVDPRYTRTCASADYIGHLRPGTNIAFINGLINYALQNGYYHKDYVENYTNASFLVDEEFDFADGEFTGFQEVDGMKSYDRSTWRYQLGEDGNPLRDSSLEHPRSVFQLLKKHVERYDIETVCNVTGTNIEDYEQIAKTFCSTGTSGKAGNVIYAMGITQHTHGTQNVRALAILQLLLGNMGIPGGGVNAQRGECNVQGSTDMAMLFHLIPGYMGVPRENLHPTLEDYVKVETPASGYWSNKPKFLISLLKAFYGDNATQENDFGYDYLPKLDKMNRSHIGIVEETKKGSIKGMFAWGQNPVVGGPNTKYAIDAFTQLDWMVAIDVFETETASFWKAPHLNPEEVETEVFMLPAASVYEKEGTVTNSGRWIQWRYQAIEPIGQCKSDLWIVDRIFNGVKELYQKEGGTCPDPILKMNWDYSGSFDKKPDVHRVALEINGYDVTTGKGLTTFGALTDDGSTACGNWIYAGYFDNADNPACKRRELEGPGGLGLHPNYAYAWPLNRRIVYNRCATDAHGKPWDDQRALFNYSGGRWEMKDVPDFNASVEPEVSAANPFIMNTEGLARIFSNGPVDGPFPEHYEPVEGPIKNALNKLQHMPVANIWEHDGSRLIELGDSQYPIIITTYRLTEHYQSGAMTRNCPSLVELMPEMFAEISREFAKELGIEPGDKLVISTPRGEITVNAMVTSRIKPVKLFGKLYHVIGMPWHWGFSGLSRGDSANVLTSHIGDPNTTIPESKAFMCNVKKAE